MIERDSQFSTQDRFGNAGEHTLEHPRLPVSFWLAGTVAAMNAFSVVLSLMA